MHCVSGSIPSTYDLLIERTYTTPPFHHPHPPSSCTNTPPTPPYHSSQQHPDTYPHPPGPTNTNQPNIPTPTHTSTTYLLPLKPPIIPLYPNQPHLIALHTRHIISNLHRRTLIRPRRQAERVRVASVRSCVDQVPPDRGMSARCHTRVRRISRIHPYEQILAHILRPVSIAA